MVNDEQFERAKKVFSELSEDDQDFIIGFLLSHHDSSMTTFSLTVAKMRRTRFQLFRAFRTLKKLSKKELRILDMFA